MGVMATGRPVLAASLDEDTNTALRAFCRRHGVSASALIEAFARAVTDPSYPDFAEAVVAVARHVDAERRARS